MTAQAVYAAVTARIFLPAEFGAFALAVTLTAFTATVSGAFVPLLMREERLSTRDVKRLRTGNMVVSMGVGLLLFVTIGPFGSLLGHPSGQDFAWPLAVASILSAVANFESAMLRRERRSQADAGALAVSFVGGILMALPLVLIVSEPWTLAANLLASPLLLVTFATLLRNRSAASVEVSTIPIGTIYGFVSRVAANNMLFVGIAQSPTLMVGQTASTSQLGNFARASTMSHIPSLALGNALIRALHPHWGTPTGSLRTEGLGNVAGTVALAALPPFALVAGVSPWLVGLWLGPGWELARQLLAPLAFGAGHAVVFNVCVSGLEIQGQFGAIRKAQGCLVLGLMVFMGILVAGASPAVAVWLLAGNHALATYVLIWASKSLSGAGEAIRGLGVPTAGSLAVGGLAFLASWSCSQLTGDDSLWDLALIVIAGGLLGACASAALVRCVLRTPSLSLAGTRRLMRSMAAGHPSARYLVG